jgi:ABC-type Zn2+ transport system substrate-binding protein/surface adhesin
MTSACETMNQETEVSLSEMVNKEEEEEEEEDSEEEEEDGDDADADDDGQAWDGHKCCANQLSIPYIL